MGFEYIAKLSVVKTQAKVLLAKPSPRTQKMSRVLQSGMRCLGSKDGKLQKAMKLIALPTPGP
jgi:hypothetical protein